MIPDKIFVCIPQRLNLSTFKEDSKYVGMAYTDRGNLTSPQVEEYIRKDALLEWLQERKKYYQSLIPAYGAVAFICALDEVKYKINSL